MMMNSIRQAKPGFDAEEIGCRVLRPGGHVIPGRESLATCQFNHDTLISGLMFQVDSVTREVQIEPINKCRIIYRELRFGSGDETDRTIGVLPAPSLTGQRQ